MSNFGLGVGSFVSGLMGGMQAGQQLQNYKRQSKLDDMELQDKQQQFQDKQDLRRTMQSAMTDATNTRNADLDKSIITGTGALGNPTYTVGGKVYQDQQQARDAVSGTVDPLHDYYMKTMAPKVRDQLMKSGDLVSATTFDKWVNDTNVQQGMRNSANALRAGMMGDWDGFTSSLVKTYNTPGYFEDGYTATGHKVLRDKDGNASGVQITLKNDHTGKETTQMFNNMGDLYRNFQNFADPTTVFNHGYAAVQAAEKARLDAVQQQQSWNQDVAKLGITQGYVLQRDNNNSQLRMAENNNKTITGSESKKAQDANAIVSILRNSGYSDDYIRAKMPTILGLQNQEKSLPGMVSDYVKQRADTDRDFARLSAPEQSRRAIAALMDREEQINFISQSRPSGLAVTPTQQKAAQGLGVTLYDPASKSITNVR